MSHTRDWTELVLGIRSLERAPTDPAAEAKPGKGVKVMTPSRKDEDPFGPVVLEIQRGIRVDENYELLYKCLRPGFLRYFIYRGFRPEDAEDLCQQVFTKVHGGIQSFEGRSRFTHWVREIAHNLYANELRRRKAQMREAREISLSPADDDSPGRTRDLPAPDPSPYNVVAARELLAKLSAVVADFPPQMRRCFYLRVYQELRFREVAAVMHVTVDTVKAHLGEARKRLRLILSDEGGILRRLDENHE